MESLNRDVGGKILLNLSYEDMSALCKIKENRKIQQLCENEDFWRSKILKDFPRRNSTIKNPSLIEKFKQDPKSLYEFINKPSKVWDITSEDAPEVHEYFPDITSLLDHQNRALEILNEELKDYSYTFPVLRGDVFKLVDYYDGQDMKYIWTGDKIISLYYNIDYEGTAPNTFSFPEFPFNHFQYSLPVDRPVICISPETSKELTKNLSDDTYPSQTFITDNYYKYYFSIAFSDNNYPAKERNERNEPFLNKKVIYSFYDDTVNGKFIFNNLMKFVKRENIY